MSRLIDADKLIHALANDFCDGKKTLGQVVDEQPTAFDVDKVINQLEKEESKARLELMEDRKTAFEFSSKCKLDAYKKALEIVKGGGVE